MPLFAIYVGATVHDSLVSVSVETPLTTAVHCWQEWLHCAMWQWTFQAVAIAGSLTPAHSQHAVPLLTLTECWQTEDRTFSFSLYSALTLTCSILMGCLQCAVQVGIVSRWTIFENLGTLNFLFFFYCDKVAALRKLWSKWWMFMMTGGKSIQHSVPSYSCACWRSEGEHHVGIIVRCKWGN
jgi:hypothetical protein